MEFNYGIFSILAYWSQNRGRGNALFGERRDELPSHEQVHTFMPCGEERDMSGAIQRGGKLEMGGLSTPQQSSQTHAFFLLSDPLQIGLNS